MGRSKQLRIALNKFVEDHNFHVDIVDLMSKKLPLDEHLFDEIMDKMTDIFLKNFDEQDEPNPYGMLIEEMRGVIINYYFYQDS